MYFTQLKSLWDELGSTVTINPCICGNAKNLTDQRNQDRVMKFLQGLHERFTGICSQILLMDPFPSIQRIHSLVCQKEQQQELHLVPRIIESAAFQASKPFYAIQ